MSPSLTAQDTPNLLARLDNIRSHMDGSSSTVFHAHNVPLAPEDPLFGLMAAYRKDDSPKKVDLGIGAYRDDNAKPWVLPVVHKVREIFACKNGNDPSIDSVTRQRNFYAKIRISIMNIFP